MDMKSAKTHFFELLDLAKKLRNIELGVPRPEGRPAIFSGGIAEKIQIKRGAVVSRIKNRRAQVRWHRMDSTKIAALCIFVHEAHDRIEPTGPRPVTALGLLCAPGPTRKRVRACGYGSSRLWTKE